jgi:hypothetical protein
VKAIIILFVIAALAWYGFKHYNEVQELASEGSALFSQSIEYSKCTTSDGRVIYGKPPVGIKCKKNESIKSSVTIIPGQNINSEGSSTDSKSDSKPSLSKGKYSCDGRTNCSQMTSCEEAEFFLRNCPNVEMDGNKDGVPCERQWCSSH